jgi:hypothetical protein
MTWTLHRVLWTVDWSPNLRALFLLVSTVFKVGSEAISWGNKLQPIVTLSTTEAEYMSAVAAGKELCWLQNLLLELGYKPFTLSKLFMDNQSSLTVAKNPEHHGHMKHLDLSY